MLSNLYECKKSRLWELENTPRSPLCVQNARRWEIWLRESKKSSDQDFLRSLISHSSETAVKILNLSSMPTQSTAHCCSCSSQLFRVLNSVWLWGITTSNHGPQKTSSLHLPITWVRRHLATQKCYFQEDSENIAKSRYSRASHLAACTRERVVHRESRLHSWAAPPRGRRDVCQESAGHIAMCPRQRPIHLLVILE